METFDFTGLELLPPDVAAVENLQQMRQSSEAHLRHVTQYPEPGYKLDFDSRPSESRQFAHIHQMCLLHATHFEMATQIKSTYVLDSYLWAVATLNPLAIYSAARSLMEMHLMTRYVEHLLAQARAGSRAEWRERGRKFFDVILKARFGTSDPNSLRLLKADGCPEDALQPIRMHKARSFVSQELPWVEEQYALLCDFVHPNMSSQRTAGAYAGESGVARSSGGGQLILANPAPIVQYQFPMPQPGRRAVHQTAARALESSLGIVGAINAMPRSPFTEEELTMRTGSPIGLRSPLAATEANVQRTGRNEPCPCGSGRKYKKCHGSVLP